MSNKIECPKCGEEKFVILELPKWEEEELSVTLSCWNCDMYVKGMLDFIPEEFDRKCVACGRTHRPLGRSRKKLCTNCKHKLIVFDCEFGFVIPRETGVVFENQTGGVMCGRRYVEGVKISLNPPKQSDYGDNEIDEKYRFDSEYIEDGQMLSALSKANYDYNQELVNEIWEDINEELWFDYESVDAPDNEMSSTEAFQWVKITGVDKEKAPDLDVDDFVGKTVVMHYPNSD